MLFWPPLPMTLCGHVNMSASWRFKLLSEALTPAAIKDRYLVLFFLLYINDISNTSNLFNLINYVDDSTLSTTLEIDIKDTTNGNIEAKINMELADNINKSKYMIFHTVQSKVTHLQLIIENTNIERVHEFTFLVLL